MATLPQMNYFTSEFEEESMGNKTYKIDYENNRIGEEIDGIDAVTQSIEFILRTERYSSLIYSWNYGVEFETLIGKDYEFILGDMRRRIEEALQQDDRIKEIDNLIVEKKKKDSILVSFTIITIIGNIDKEIEVMT